VSCAEFDLGLLVTKPGAMDLIRTHSTDGSRVVERLVERHAIGDWGAVDADDARANDDAARDGDRILSSYALACGDDSCRVDHRLWLLTEADPLLHHAAASGGLLMDEPTMTAHAPRGGQPGTAPPS
jgi:hypothetical protein